MNDFLEHAHAQLNTWTVRLVYTMRTADVYVVDDAHFHAEPHYGDVNEVLSGALTARQLAVGQNTLLTIRSHHGFPIALNPDEIASIRPDLVGPDNQPVVPIKPGWMELADDDEAEPGAQG